MSNTEFKFWFLSPNNKNIQCGKSNIEKFKIKDLLKCKSIDCVGYFFNKKTYTIWFNSKGMFEETEYNSCASKFLTKTPIEWGTKHLNGNFIITCMDENENYIDMDISPKQFIKNYLAVYQDKKCEEESEEENSNPKELLLKFLGLNEDIAFEYCKKLKNEFMEKYKNKIPAKVININVENGDFEECMEILNEEITFKDIVAYIFYVYYNLREEKIIGTFKKIILPDKEDFDFKTYIGFCNNFTMDFFNLIARIKYNL
jgi:hypothetical protein